MTVSVKVHVNGRHRAHVTRTPVGGSPEPAVIVEGNYEGSGNPSGEETFYLNGNEADFNVREEAVPVAPAKDPAAAAV